MRISDLEQQLSQDRFVKERMVTLLFERIAECVIFVETLARRVVEIEFD